MESSTARVNQVFADAMEIESPEDRTAFLDKECGGDYHLRKEVEALLKAHDKAASFLEQPVTGLRARPDTTNESKDSGPTAKGETANFADTGKSVLKSLGKHLQTVPHVLLRDANGDVDPIAFPRSKEVPQTGAKYQLLGEIARGGIGAILKGRDTDIGRDLAVKVLLDEHKDKPEVLQRFIEEAQIGGQLQHPGIAPVYELGQFDDERPFFSMKLIKGETLSTLLAGRDQPSDDRGKLLTIFDQICQTMAYAHSRGVIHRDLKPSNIMVGAFGEVQVMDWGLAKVLSSGGVADEKKAFEKHKDVSVIQTSRSVGSGSDTPGSFGSDTRMGSVLGTPAYMPPEQALGEIDHLDERSDVFGLGAILCEILTGQPPYVGENGGEVLRLAARGKLQDCFARLDSSGADTELVELAKRCLASEPGDRPRDAGDMAAGVSGYLESVEAKLREAELERSAQAARTVEERKRRKVLLGLAGSVLFSIGIGVAAWIWTQQKEAALVQTKADAEYAALVQERQKEIEVREAVRRRAYTSGINLAQRALEQDNVARAHRLLSEHIPSEGQEDLRGWEWRYLWQHSHSQADYALEKIEDKPHWGLHVSRDGRWLASVHETPGALAPVVIVHDLSMRKRVARFSGGGGWECLAMSANEGILAFAPENTTNSVMLQTLTPRESIAEIRLNNDVLNMEFSGSGEYLAVADTSRINLYRTSDWELVKSQPATIDYGHGDPFALSYDAQFVAFFEGQQLVVFNWKTEKTQWTQPISDHVVSAVAFSHDESMLAMGTGYAATNVVLRSASTGEELAQLVGHRGWVSGLQFWPDGSKLASSSADKSLRIWDIRQLDAPACVQTLLGHTSEVWAMALQPEQNRVYSGGKNGETLAWDLDTIQERSFPNSLDREVSNWTFRSDGKSLVTVDQSGRVEQWSVPDLELVRLVVTLPDESRLRARGSGRPRGPCFSENGQLLAVVSEGGEVQVWDLGKGTVTSKLPTTEEDSPHITNFWGPERLLLCYEDSSLHLWNIATQSEEVLPEVQRMERGAWSLSPDHQSLYLVSDTGPGQIVSRDSEQIEPFQLNTQRVVDIAFTRDAARFAVASQVNGAAQLWDLATHQPIGLFQEHLMAVHSVDFSPDDRRLATGGASANAVKIWDVETQRELLNLAANGAIFGITRFSPDGNAIGASDTSGHFHLWHAPSWQEIAASEATAGSNK